MEHKKVALLVVSRNWACAFIGWLGRQTEATANLKGTAEDPRVRARRVPDLLFFVVRLRLMPRDGGIASTLLPPLSRRRLLVGGTNKLRGVSCTRSCTGKQEGAFCGGAIVEVSWQCWRIGLRIHTSNGQWKS